MQADGSSDTLIYKWRAPDPEEGVTPPDEAAIPEPGPTGLVARTAFTVEGTPLIPQLPDTWRISTKLKPSQRSALTQNHEAFFGSSPTFLAAMLYWIAKLKVDLDPITGQRGTTWAELAIDFELTTAHPILKTGQRQGSFGASWNMTIGERARSLAHHARTLFQYFLLNEEPCCPTAHRHCAALRELGLPEAMGLTWRFCLVNETQVTTYLHQWALSAAERTIIIQQRTTAQRRLTPKFAQRRGRHLVGPFAWAPQYTDLQGVDVPVRQYARSLICTGASARKFVRISQLQAENEQKRVKNNLLTYQCRCHLIRPGPLTLGQPIYLSLIHI